MLGPARLVGLAGAVAAATMFAALPGGAATLRSGLARAQVARVVPYVGIPSIGAGVGVAQAEITGPGAHASAGLADFGAMSLILGQVASKAPVPLPDLPAPITADDRDHPDVARDPVAPPAAPPGASPAGASPAGAPVALGAPPLADPAPPAPTSPAAAHEEAHASGAPASRALVRGPEFGVPGVLTFTAGQSAASADGGASSSTVHLGRLALGGSGGVPEVVLSDLVWTARQEMGQPGSASFTIGSATVAGQALPVPAASPADVLKAVNDALAPAGLRLEAPASTAGAAGGAVSSLVVQVRNPEAVANVAAGAVKPAVPVLNQVLDQLLAAAPDAAASRLVVNALLATGTTRGGGRLELGGAAARIGNVEVADLTPPPPPPLESVDAASASPPPFAVAPEATAPVSGGPTPDPSFDPGSGHDSGTAPFGGPDSPGGNGLLAAPESPIAPSGAARALGPPAAPDGSTLRTDSVTRASPLGSTGPGGAPAPLVLSIALLAVVILAVGDKLRLRRITG